MNFPQAVRFSSAATLPELYPSAGRANLGIVFAVVAAIIVWIILSKALKGFELRVIGQSPRAGRFAGFSTSQTVIFAFLVSGALAGLAGISEVSGAIGRLQPQISPGYGFAAIIVAFLGRLNPLGIVAAGFVLALSYLGGEAAQIAVGVTDKTVRAFQGMLLFFVLACDTLIRYRVRFVFNTLAKIGETSHGNG
jgi:simple sugar transport system permease protein